MGTRILATSLTIIFVVLLVVFASLYITDGKILDKVPCVLNLPIICQNNHLPKYIPVTKEPVSFNLEINNPDDNMISFDKTIIVSGKTAPHTTVIISTDNNDLGLEANVQGEFSKVVNLSVGLNNLTITAIDSSGNQKANSRTIFYSEEKI